MDTPTEQKSPSTAIRALPVSPSSSPSSPSSSSPSPSSPLQPTTFSPPTPSQPNPALPLLEQKCALVSTALNALGMGRYQWAIFGLCGYGYFLDLAWAQAFSVVLVPMTQEFGVSTANSGQIFTAFSAGLTAGAFTWGLLVDIIGRKWAFNLTTLICSIFGLVIGAPSSWSAVCVLTAFCGFGLGGNIPIDATILLEFVPKNRRFLVMLLSIFQPLGVVACSLLAWLLIPAHSCSPSLPACSSLSTSSTSSSSSGPFTAISPSTCCTRGENAGWRELMYVLGGITLGCFLLRFLVFRFRESPRFLLTQGRDADAVRVVQQIYAYNRAGECPLTLEDLEELDRLSSAGASQDLPTQDDDAEGNKQSSERSTTHRHSLRKRYGMASQGTTDQEGKTWWDLSHLRALFSTWRAGRIAVLVVAVYMFDYWGFSVAGAFLPSILLKKGAARDIGVYETYRNYIIISLSGIPGVALGAYLVDLPLLGRKWSMVLTSLLMAVSLFLFVAIDSQAANVAFNALEYAFQSAFNAVLYGYAPELFHTSTRGTAVGLASCFGRLTSIVSPLIAAKLYADTGTDAVLYLAGGGTLLATLAAVGLPETRGREVF